MTLRTYSRMRSVSAKRQRQQPAEATVRREVMERAQYRCEVTLSRESAQVVYLHDPIRLGALLFIGRCPQRAVEGHHVVKRSQRGATDSDNVIAICRRCHDATDRPFKRGRLVIEALGRGRFRCVVRYASDKWTARP